MHRTQKGKVAKAVLFHEANGFLRSSRLRPFITCTHITFQRLFIAQGKTKLPGEASVEKKDSNRGKNIYKGLRK